MQLAIIGLPFSGKTTVFNAATRGAAQVAGYSGAASPNIGIAKVPDARLDTLTRIYKPQKTTPAEITYVDLPAAPDGLGKTRGISGVYLNQIQTADALVVVARGFDDPSVPDGGDGVDAFRDVETMLYELTFADLDIVQRRIDRIAQNRKGARSADRDALERERRLMASIMNGLEDGEPIRNQSLTPDAARRVNEFQFLTAKPVIAVVNAGEDLLDEVDELQARLESEVADDGVLGTVLVGSLEMELAQMSPEDEAEFRESLGAGESGLDRMVRLSYRALDQITFFTGGAQGRARLDGNARRFRIPRRRTHPYRHGARLHSLGSDSIRRPCPLRLRSRIAQKRRAAAGGQKLHRSGWRRDARAVQCLGVRR